MSKRVVLPAVFAAALLSLPACAATDDDLAQIREQIRQLKETYEARINALEARVKEAEARAAAVANAPPPTPPAAPAAEAPPPVAAAPSAASPASGIAAFNPAISVVLQGRYANFSQDPGTYTLSGFQTGGDASLGHRGFSLSESELAISANVDDKFAGNLIVSLAPDNSVSVEEAYGFMPSLGNGLVPRFGRFFSGIGYLNEQHQHVWDFVDAPLAYQAFLGGQFTQDGVQAKWVAPTDVFLEFGAELGSGDSFPGTSRNRNGANAKAAYVHAGGDIGDSNSWRAGVSYLHTSAGDRTAQQLD